MHSHDTFHPRTSLAHASPFAGLFAAAALVLVGSLATGCGPKPEAASTSGSGEPGSAQALVDKKCSSCHPLSTFSKTRGDAAKWTTVVDAMVKKGMKVTDQEKTEIIGYLAANQGP